MRPPSPTSRRAAATARGTSVPGARGRCRRAVSAASIAGRVAGWSVAPPVCRLSVERDQDDAVVGAERVENPEKACVRRLEAGPAMAEGRVEENGQ